MGSAILEGLLRHKSTESSPEFQYTAHVRSQSSSNRLKQTFSSHLDIINLTVGNDQLIQATTEADIIMLGFVPGDLDTVLGTNDFASHLKGKTVISLLAGISTDQLLSSLQAHSSGSSKNDFNVARIIPTLGAKVGESVTLVAESPTTTAANAIVEGIFSRIGSVHPMPERLMDTATAIGAAVHALAFVAVDTATDASVADGMFWSQASNSSGEC